MKQSKIEDNLRKVYNQYPEAFKSDKIKELVWYYWMVFDAPLDMVGSLLPKGVDGAISKDFFLKATSSESITRARRKILEEKGIKDPKSIEAEKEYHDYYANKGL